MKGIIYKIIDTETKETYIGSTIRSLDIRISQHKSQKSLANEILKKNNYRITILEEIEFSNIDKLRICEQNHMDKTDNLINKNRAFENKTSSKEYHKEYYEKNKDKFKLRNGDRKLNYQFKKTWGDTNNNLLDINKNIFK
jgi:DNA polymerase sigma